MRVLPLAIMVVLALPVTAHGATVRITGSDLDVVGGGENSNMTVVVEGANFRVKDVNSPVTAAGTCTQDGANDALCPRAGVTRIDARMGDNSDQLTIAPAITVEAQILGENGSDTLRGGAGDDLIDGGTSDDTLQGFGGADRLVGGSENDTAVYEDRTAATDRINVTINDGLANDGDVNPVEGDEVKTENVTGGAGNDMIRGDDGPNGLSGQGGNDTIHALGGNDFLGGGFATEGGDFLFGGDGNDAIDAHAGNDHADGGEGNDNVRGFEGSDVLLGGPGHDAVRDWDDAGEPDDLDGGPGNDQMSPTRGGGKVYGGPGVDSVDLQSMGGTTHVTLAGGADDTGSNGTYDVRAFEMINMAGGNDDVTGTDADETILGHGGDDVLRGMGGNDHLQGHGGNDQMLGGDGVDMSDFNDISDCNVTLDGVANDTNSHVHSGGFDNADTENVIGCGGGVNVLTGNDGPNLIIGQGPPDTISGLGGDDVLQGGNNADQLNGGGGADILDGGNDADDLNGQGGDDRFDGNGGGADDMDGGPGDDLADYSAVTPGGLTITLDGTANDADGDNVDTERVLGSYGNDTITGGPGPEELDGGPGDDQVMGGGGDDLLIGQVGADLLQGDAGADRVDYGRASGPVAVQLNGLPDDGVAGEADDVRVEQVVGSDFDDLIVGDGTANLLSGGDGADDVDGGAGDDTVVGGPGTDTLRSGVGADALRALDGEADTLVCATDVAKDVEADAIDTGPDCIVRESAVPVGSGDGAGAGPLPSALLLPEPLAIEGPARPSGTPPRGADALAQAFTGRPRRRGRGLGVTRSGLDIGDLVCLPGRLCAVDVVVRRAGRGKKATIARAKLADAGAIDVLVPLTKVGRRALRKRGMRVRARIVLTEGQTTTTMSLNFKIRRFRR